MHEIICPHCGKAFKIDEAGYSDILKQVRDADFEKQLHERLELAERDKQNAVELAQAKVTCELQKAASEKDAEIQALKARLDAGEVAQKLAVSEALSAVEKDRDALTNALEKAKQENETKAQLAEAKRLSELQQADQGCGDSASAGQACSGRSCAKARAHRSGQRGDEGA